jgi:DHA2 family multidrug resistance protein-like MFS transporter
LTLSAAAGASETLGGATAVASSLPAPQAAELLASAQQAFGSGVGITSVIAAAVMLAAAAMVWFALRGTRTES